MRVAVAALFLLTTLTALAHEGHHHGAHTQAAKTESAPPVTQLQMPRLGIHLFL